MNFKRYISIILAILLFFSTFSFAVATEPDARVSSGEPNGVAAVTDDDQPDAGLADEELDGAATTDDDEPDAGLADKKTDEEPDVATEDDEPGIVQPAISVQAKDTFTIGAPFAFTVTSDIAGIISVSVNGLDAMCVEAGRIEADEPFEVAVESMPYVQEARFVITIRPESVDLTRPAITVMEVLTVYADGEAVVAPELVIYAEDTFTQGEAYALAVSASVAGSLMVLLDEDVAYEGPVAENGMTDVVIGEMPEQDEAVILAVLTVDGEEAARAELTVKKTGQAGSAPMAFDGDWTLGGTGAPSGNTVTTNWGTIVSGEGASSIYTLRTHPGGGTGGSDGSNDRGVFVYQTIPKNADFRISGWITMTETGNVFGNAAVNLGFMLWDHSAPEISNGNITNTYPNQITNQVSQNMVFSGLFASDATSTTPRPVVNVIQSRLNGSLSKGGAITETRFQLNHRFYAEIIRIGDDWHAYVDGVYAKLAANRVPTLLGDASGNVYVGMFNGRGMTATFESVVLEELTAGNIVDGIDVSTVPGQGYAFSVSANNPTDLSGVTFTAMNDGTELRTFTPAEASFMVNGNIYAPNALPADTTGLNTATVSYGGVEKEFTYLVLEDVVEKVELLARPLKTVYALNEELDLLGVSVRLTWASGRTAVFNHNDEGTVYNITGFSSTAANPALTLTVVPTDVDAPATAKATFDVEIKGMAIELLEIANAPNLTYYEGHAVPGRADLLKGLVIRAVFNDGPNPTTRTLTDVDVTTPGYGSAPFSGNWVAGTHDMKIEYGDAEVMLPFVAHKVEYVGLTVDTYPTKTTYVQNNPTPLSFDGIDVRALNNDGTMSDKLTQGVDYTLAHEFNVAVVGLYPVTVTGIGSYATLTPTSFNLSVMENIDYTSGWQHRRFGESAGAQGNSVPTFIRGSLNEMDWNTEFTLRTINSAGKIQDNASDGVNFVYYRLPAYANFNLSATIEVISLGENRGAAPLSATHQQQSLGIMMRETIDPDSETNTKTLSNMWMFGPLGDQGTPRQTNHNIAPRIRNMEDPNWIAAPFYPSAVWGKDGDPVGEGEGSHQVGALPASAYFTHRPWYNSNRTETGIYINNGFTHSKDFNTIEVEFVRSNNNFSGKAMSGPASAPEIRTWDRTDDTNFSYTQGGFEDAAGLIPCDDWIYVGFFTTRDAEIKVSNISLTVTDGRAEKDGQEVVRDPTAPRLQFNSSAVVSTLSDTAEYELKYAANADGTAIVYYNSQPVETLQITAGKQYSFIRTVTRSGLNNFAVELFPNPNGNYTSFNKVTEFLAVTFDENLAPGDLYVSNEGVAGRGENAENPTTLADAINRIAPGNTIHMLPGRYVSALSIAPRHSSNAAEGYKRIVAHGEVFVGTTTVNPNTGAFIQRSNVTSSINGDYWHIKGIIFDGNIRVGGNNNVIEMCTVRNSSDTGLQISNVGSIGGLAANDRVTWPGNNIILNVESYGHRDATNMNADGFAAKITAGEGNRFIGCIAHHNIDDGYDFYAKSDPIGAVTLEYCLAYRNGMILDDLTNEGADGNGFKLGGSGVPVFHVIRNSIAFENKSNGFSSNSNPHGVVQNCVSFDNRGSNLRLYGSGRTPRDFRVENFYSYRKNIAGGSNNNGTPDVIETMRANGTISSDIADARKVTFEGHTAPHSIYLWSGNLASGSSTNDLGRRVTDKFFENVDKSIVNGISGLYTNAWPINQPYHYGRNSSTTNNVDVGQTTYVDDIDWKGFLVLTPYAEDHTNLGAPPADCTCADTDSADCVDCVYGECVCGCEACGGNDAALTADDFTDKIYELRFTGNGTNNTQIANEAHTFTNSGSIIGGAVTYGLHNPNNMAVKYTLGVAPGTNDVYVTANGGALRGHGAGTDTRRVFDIPAIEGPVMIVVQWAHNSSNAGALNVRRGAAEADFKDGYLSASTSANPTGTNWSDFTATFIFESQGSGTYSIYADQSARYHSIAIYQLPSEAGGDDDCACTNCVCAGCNCAEGQPCACGNCETVLPPQEEKWYQLTFSGSATLNTNSPVSLNGITNSVKSPHVDTTFDFIYTYASGTPGGGNGFVTPGGAISSSNNRSFVSNKAITFPYRIEVEYSASGSPATTTLTIGDGAGSQTGAQSTSQEDRVIVSYKNEKATNSTISITSNANVRIYKITIYDLRSEDNDCTCGGDLCPGDDTCNCDHVGKCTSGGGGGDGNGGNGGNGNNGGNNQGVNNNNQSGSRGRDSDVVSLSGSGVSGGGVSTTLSAQQIGAAQAQNLMQTALSNGLGYVNTHHTGTASIGRDALQAVGNAGLFFFHDTVQNGVVQVRMYIDQPLKVENDLFVSGYVSGASVQYATNTFGYWFNNNFSVASLDQQGSFGQTVRIAAKLNLTGMDVNDLYFYAYNREANTYTRILTEYKIDAKGYLNFATQLGGDIIVSNGPLTKKTEEQMSQYLGSTRLESLNISIDVPPAYTDMQTFTAVVDSQAPMYVAENPATVEALANQSAEGIVAVGANAGTPVIQDVIGGPSERGVTMSMTTVIILAAALMFVAMLLWAFVPRKDDELVSEEEYRNRQG